MNILSMLLSGLGGGQQPAPAAQGPSTAGAAPPSAGQVPASIANAVAASKQYVDPSGKPVDPNATAEVAPLEVTAPPKPKAPPPQPPIQYDNSQDAQAVQKALGQMPQVDGDTGRGLWGVLPNQVQHGTVRDILGAIGDAFLVHSGRQAMYQPRVDNRTVGQAMAGYANNPQAAIERVAATGAPGSIEMADKMEQNLQNLEIRKQIAEQNNDYRKAMIQSRNEGIVARMAPIVAGWAQGAKTPDDYKKAYDRATAAAQRIDPSYDATMFGYVDPQDWQPGSMTGVGATTGQIMHNQTSQDSIQERRDAAGMAHADRQAALRAHPQQATTNTTLQQLIAKQNRGEQLTPAEQAYWNYHTTRGKGGGGGLHAAGGGPVPSQSDINYLRQHPNMRAQFEAHFGKGSSSRYIR
jgi:hypothetical protein